jgi:hypothetical protein
LEISLKREEGWSDPKILLLHHCREILGRWADNKIRSSDLVEAIKQTDDGPWSKMSQWILATQLRGFCVYPVPLRFGKETSRGYTKRSFQVAFDRYLR